MYIPSIDSTFPQHYSLFKSVDILLALIENDKNNDFPELVLPVILTLYSGFECFLSNIEQPILESSRLNPKYEKRPKMENRPFVLYEILKNEKFDKQSTLYDNYNHFVKLRNLVAHSKYESINWPKINISTNKPVKMSSSYISKKEMRKVDRTAVVSRDKKADKVISFLKRRKIINIENDYRMVGWIYCIQIPEVAIWANKTISELMLILGEDRNNNFY